MERLYLNAAQVDALQEVTNIGLGNAATSLAEMTGRVFSITVPAVRPLDGKGLEQALSLLHGDSADEPVVAIYMPFRGNLEGHFAFVLPWNRAAELWDMLLGDHPRTPDDMTDMYASAALEVGNIIISGYLNAIGTLTGIACIAEPPYLAVDTVAAIVETVICAAEPDGPAGLLLDTRIEDANKSIEGFFLYLPTAGGVEALFECLGVQEAA